MKWMGGEMFEGPGKCVPGWVDVVKVSEIFCKLWRLTFMDLYG